MIVQAPDESLAIDIRPATGDDVPWVYSSWLKSYREHGGGMSRIPPEAYFHHQREKITATIARAGVMTIVACPSDNDAQILGWLCGEVKPQSKIPYDAVWYYGHVKATHRRNGIMRELMRAFGMTKANACAYTHHTRLQWIDEARVRTVHMSEIVPPTWHYNPYLFRG